MGVRRPGVFQLTQKAFLVRPGPSGDELLVLRDARSGRGDLPGGRLDEGELHGEWRDALARELVEELGPEARWTLDPAPRFWFKHRIHASGYDALGFAWTARWEGGEVALSEEHDRLDWVPLATLDPSAWFTDHLADAVRRFLAPETP